MKNKTLIIASVIIVALIFAGILIIKRSFVSSPSDTQPPQEEAKQDLRPADPSIGVDLKLAPNKHDAVVTISKIPGDVISIETELQYTHTTDGITKEGEGAFRKKSISGETEVVLEITLGTCSKTCRYHTNIRDLQLTIKFLHSYGSGSFLTQNYPKI